MSNNPNQPQTDDAVLGGQSPSPTSLPQCPVCKTEYIEGEVNRCSVCNWDLISCPEAFVEKHNAQLAWAREMWVNFQAEEKQLQALQSQLEEVKQKKARFEGAVLHRLEKLEQAQDSSEGVIWANLPQNSSKDNELEKQLSKVKEQLKEAEKERQKLKSEMSQISLQLAKLEAEQQKKIADDPQLVSAVGIDYSRLRDFLAAGEWEKANNETNLIINAIYRLLPGEKSISQFPCSDLVTIDQLWMRYSYGKFGFSVQNRIYEEEGGDYNSLALAVGWRSWIAKEAKEYSKKYRDWYYTGNRNDLSFSLYAPVGHLPVLIIGWIDRLTAIKSHCILLKRISLCNLNPSFESNLEPTSYFEIDEALRTYDDYSYYDYELDPKLHIPIEELQLSVRAYNSLKRADLNSVATLLSIYDMNIKDLLESENYKVKLAKEVNEALYQYLGITLPSKYLEEESEYLEE